MPIINMDYVEYNGKKYPTRDIFLSGYSNSGEFWYGEYTVSVESLNDEIERNFNMPMHSEEHDRASWVDNGIFYYVPDDIINAGDDKLCQFIMDNL